MTRPNVLIPPGSVRLHPGRRPSRPVSERARPEVRQRQGKILVVAGWIIAMVGVLVYCVASFAAAADVGLAAILLDGAVPAARAGLFVVGGGTLLWAIGSVMHLSASLDVPDDEPGER
jgi:hypothetical protein